MYANCLKRVIDFFCALMAIICLSPLLIVVSILIRIDMGSPIFFKQHRIGKDDKEFSMYKFRSMSDARDENGVFLPDDQRITKLGNFIRKTSIDELPSLLNILKGDMAVIGPRPLPTRYLSRYTQEQRRRHEVRPGLSNPSTVNGRNSQTWEQQFAGDVWYVDHVSFLTDVKSIFDTIKVVLNHSGATAEDGGARGEFIGVANIEDLKTDAEGNYMKL
ncbi:sugar transferase [uncultured Fibrobacter sp.]|uniref:sugar transferase n=1 Tax=uncultured Fibrobacter sp. TaxID=261512 RepID=UPI00261BB9F2|nr:sugar transferase [uncultured Fibrobacter sp.]